MKLPITDALVFISRRLRIMAGTALLVMAVKIVMMPGHTPDPYSSQMQGVSRIAIQTSVSE